MERMVKAIRRTGLESLITKLQIIVGTILFILALVGTIQSNNTMLNTAFVVAGIQAVLMYIGSVMD